MSTTMCPCIFCEKPVKSHQQAIDCDSCGRWQHRGCGNTGVTKYMYGRLKSGKITVQFVCERCNVVSLQNDYSAIEPDHSTRLMMPPRPSGPLESSHISFANSEVFDRDEDIELTMEHDVTTNAADVTTNAADVTNEMDTSLAANETTFDVPRPHRSVETEVGETSVADETINRGDIGDIEAVTTFEVVETGSIRGKRKLVSSSGYAYVVKRQLRNGTTEWRCSVRGHKKGCPAVVRQAGENFSQSYHTHSHTAQPGISSAVKVISEVKTSGKQNLFETANNLVRVQENGLQALLTGLAVMCPDDPHEFIIEKLKILIECGLDGLEWDLFVEEWMKPVNKIISESNLEFIFNLDDESMLPTPEMYEKAYFHYNTKVKKTCFSAWMQYYLLKKRKKLALARKMAIASKFHAHRMLRVHIHEWIEWVKYRKGRQAMSFQKLQHVLHVSIGRVIFEAWHNHTLEARRQREYFERLERGENMEDDDAFGQGTGEARDSLSTLPRKLAIQIFRYVDIADLARCACVCRSWKVITQSSSLWNRLDFYRVRNRITNKVVTKMLYKCRPYLIHLNVRGCMYLTERCTYISIAECCNLQDLNFSECSGLTDEMLKIVATGCKILLYLNVSYTNITDASLRTIAKWCNNVQYLSLAHCKKFSDRGLQYLASGKTSSKLDYLDLSGCLQITPDGFKNLCSGCVNIQTLILNEFPTLNDESMNHIGANCIKLQSLSVLGSPLLSDEAFKRIANNKNLRKLKIDGNHRISDFCLKLIGMMCTNLEHIYIADCQRLTDAALKSLSSCRLMKVANFADCVRISDKGVRQLVDGPCGPRLHELNLTNCIRVGDMAMVNIHKRCHNLTYLSVCYCEHISEAGIELLGQTHSITSLDISGCNCGDQGLSALGNNVRLRDVTLSECANITDLGLQKFAQQCKNIERLDLSHCMQITDGAIKNLAFCCRSLNVLNLAGCKLVTDLSIQYLSGVCHYLLQLDVSGCLLITDKALKYLRKGCKKLNFLVLLYCRGVSKNSAQKMLRHVERVQYSSEDIPHYFGYS